MSEFDDLDNFDFAFDSSLSNIMGDNIFGEGTEPTSMDEVGVDPGLFLPNTEGRSEFLPPDPDRVPQIPDVIDREAPGYAERPAEERTRELFSYMHPHRQVLLGVLRAAQSPISNADIADVITELRAHKFSVYSPANICTMLETAGALDRVVADGTPYEEFEPQPNIVVIDGEEYWEPVEAPEPYWTITDAGTAQLESNDPMDRLDRTFQREGKYLRIWKKVLEMGTAENAPSMSDFSAAIDSDPLIAEPRVFFVQHFVEQMERCEAISWQGDGWHTTEFGQRALAELLADVNDEFTPADDAQPAELESQGVNW